MQRVVTILMAAMFVGVVIASEWDTGPRVMTDDEARATVGGQVYTPCGACAGINIISCRSKPGQSCGLTRTVCIGVDPEWTCCQLRAVDTLSFCPVNELCDVSVIQDCWKSNPGCD